MILLLVDKIVVVKFPSWKIQAYDVFFDALSSNSNLKSKRRLRKYENRQKPVIFGKKWPNQGDNRRIIVIHLNKKIFFV